MDITVYAFPALVSLVAKAAIFFYARFSLIRNLQTRIYLFLLFAIAIQNLAEVTFFVAHAKHLPAPPGGILYFVASIIALALILHIAVEFSSFKVSPRTIFLAIYAPAIVLEVLLLKDKSLVSGFTPMGYTYTRIPGPHYFLFELYAVIYLLISITLFLTGARSDNISKQLKNKLMIVGVAPTVLLVTTVIGLQHFGFQGFNTTATLPLAVTFFLAVTAYATHQRRLFDIEFFLPWSKVRRRKTAFYKRIQLLIAEIAEMSSVQRIIQSISDALHCPVTMIGGPRPALAMAGEAFGIARFPLGELKKIDRIVIANEISRVMPTTHELMRRHKVAAIVPFHPYSQAAASWMLFGEAFSEQVYSPLDFKAVETLFARLADHFLDNQFLLRSQLLEAQREMDALHARLANAWEQIEALRQELSETKAENRQIRQQPAETPHRDLATNREDALTGPEAEQKSFDKYVAEYEVRLIAKTLEHCGGDVSRAAELLCLPIETLRDKLLQIRSSGNDPAEPEVLFV